MYPMRDDKDPGHGDRSASRSRHRWFVVPAGSAVLAAAVAVGATTWVLSGQTDDAPSSYPGVIASSGASVTGSAASAPSAAPPPIGGPGGQAGGDKPDRPPTPTATRTTKPPTTGSGGSNPDTFVKGDCFVNEGTENDAEVRKVACTTAKSYEVVAKVPFTTDEKRCDTTAGAGRWNASYVMDKSPGTSGDYVLCLRKR
ncbi:hypothetical protein GCM10009557_29740 [Virgisporangium ochraceum]|uniref:Uncharacterized protein n=1 Tax=Virgisporangium ochraceum TaxID=65505 RepID=A0A8J4EFN1_9ACTN|nr:hypothetical protein [Virgisporangium ochraceum]GIJ72896.1 hypothetical protein Voc01_078130 [Virgisporangium ochraceum]